MDALEEQIRTLRDKGLAREKIAEGLGISEIVVHGVLGAEVTAPSNEDDEQLAKRVLRDIAGNTKVHAQARIIAATTLLDEHKGRRGAAVAAATAIGAAALQDALAALNSPKRAKAYSVFDKPKEIKV